jgi:23S rRNA pseudouridine1911/1915/1917 synthase
MKSGASARWTVAGNEAGGRVDAWLARRREVGSRARAREWIERGKVFLNGTEVTFDRAGERVRAGDDVVVWEDRPGSSRPRSRDLVTHRQALRIVFEDGRLLVADKPPGLLVEPLPGDPSEVTLRDLVSDHLRSRHALVVHRIDRDTSGLVLFAKDEAATVALKRQFERRTAERVYVAVLCGRLPHAQGTWKDALVWDAARLVQRRARPDDERGKEAVSSYKVLEQFEEAALVEVRLVTGKRNQIRIQAALRHVPLVGERIYRSRTSSGVRPSTRSGRGGPVEPRSPRSALRHAQRVMSLSNHDVRDPTSEVAFPRQALHAARLAFRHPDTGARVEFVAALPADMRRLIATLRTHRTRQG